MIDFSNCSVFSYSHTSEFLGDIIHYRTTKNLSIKGSVYALTNTEGVAPIWSGISGLVSSAIDYDSILLNGVDFGSGRINSISFTEGNDVRKKDYAVDLTIYQTGNLYNVLSGFYSGLDFTNFDKMADLSESFTYQRTPNTSYSHEVSLQVDCPNGLDIAKTIAASFLSATNVTGFLGNYGLNIKKYSRESYNSVTNTSSFSENADFVQNSGAYSFNYTNSIRTDENGITNVTENGEVKGLVEPLSGSAMSGYNEQAGLVFSRCSGIYANYLTGELISAPIVKGTDINTFEGIVSYNYQYTNDPRIYNTYTWEYTHSLERNDQGIYNVNENGEIKGIGRKLDDKYTNAISAWTTIETGISGRCDSFYPGEYELKPINDKLSKSQFDGSVSYARVYTDDLSILNGENIKKREITVSDTFPTHLVNKFIVTNYKEVAQGAGIPTLGQRNLNLSLLGARSLAMTGYLNEAKVIAATLVPSGLGDDVYIADSSYSYSPIENNFNFSLSWIFHNSGRAVYDITL
jgi:hypothetical protein